MANGDDSHETPYVIQMPDGSTQSRVWVTDRPVTHGEVDAYVSSQGGTYMGPPQPSAPAPPPPPAPEWQPPPPLPPNATDADRARRAWALGSYEPPAPAPPPASPMSPVPAPTPVVPPRYFLSGPLDYAFAPPGVEPSPTGTPEVPPAAAQTVRNVYLPQRSVRSQVPEILGATTFGVTGGALAAPLGPELAIPVGMASAGLGGGIGEGTTILAEKLTGAPPAEPGTAWQRIGNAAARSATVEGATRAVTYPAALVASRLMPAARATEEVLPVLRETPSLATTPPKDILTRWQLLGEEGQRLLAGEHLPAYQTLMDTIAQGEKAWGKLLPGISASGILTSIMTGHPLGALPSLAPTAWEGLAQGASKAASQAIRTPAVQPWFAMLPRAAQVSEPLVSVPLRLGTQTLATQPQVWPPAEAFPLGGGSE